MISVDPGASGYVEGSKIWEFDQNMHTIIERVCMVHKLLVAVAVAEVEAEAKTEVRRAKRGGRSRAPGVEMISNYL